MKFALNYSPEAAELVRSGLIDIDLFKVPNWDNIIDDASQIKPVYVHFAFQAGQNDATPEALNAAELNRKKTGTPYVNTHLIPRITDVSDPYNSDQVVNAMLRDIRPLVGRFGAENVIAENIPFPERTRDKSPLCVDPIVICRTIETAGIGLLLDIGHARRTAEYMAIDPRRYILSLPVQYLREVHITGLGYDRGGLRVDHLAMREDDWELFAWVLDNIRLGTFATPAVVACEYGGVGENFRWRSDINVIRDQIPRMYRMVKEAIRESVL